MILIDDEIDEAQVNNNLINTCARNIFTQIEEGSYREDLINADVTVINNDLLVTFAERIITLFSNPIGVNYRIQEDLLVGKNAQTSGDVNGVYTTLNSDYLNVASELSIARTMIHELVHAYLTASNNFPVTLDSYEFREAMELYALENGIDDVNSNEFHHEFMNQYINAIAISLREWDTNYGTGGDLGYDYYWAMSFSGMFQVDLDGNILNETDSFLELVPDEDDRELIKEIIVNESENNENARGSSC